MLKIIVALLLLVSAIVLLINGSKYMNADGVTPENAQNVNRGIRVSAILFFIALASSAALWIFTD